MTPVLSLLFVLSLFYAAVILFFRQGLKNLRPGMNPRPHSFSVLIAARNEEAFIGRCLDGVLGQDYAAGPIEVIVVDDRSTDRTGDIVKARAAGDSRLKLLRVDGTPEGVSPKKHALSLAAAAARHEILLFTDADCVVPPTWLAAMNAHFYPETGAVGGLTTYHPSPDLAPWFWGVQSLDFLSHAVVSAAAIGAGLPINTNANNFAVRRDLFLSVRGYESVEGVVSGDDDLLLQKISASPEYTIDYAPEPGAAVTTEPSGSVRRVWEQRKRWGSKTVYYHPGQVALLAGVFGYYCLLLAAFLLAPFLDGMAWRALLFFAFKTLLDFLLLKQGALLFGKTPLLRYFPVAAILHIPLIVAACFAGIFGRFQWKDGRVRRRLAPEGSRNS